MSEQEGADMKGSILVAAMTFCIMASPAPSTAQDKFGRWPPPVKLSHPINSESVKERSAISRQEDDEDEEGHNRCPQHRFCEFSDWSKPIWLGPIVNSSADDYHPAISHNGFSLYITSTRPGGLGSADIWVSQRDSLDDQWGPPQNLGPNINTVANEFAPDFSPDGHWLFFSSGRLPGTNDFTQIWASYRKDVDDDFGWGPAVKLPGDINMPGLDDNAPTFFHDHKTGVTSIYFNSILRKDGPGDFDIYVSTQLKNGTFGAAKVVRELDSPQRDTRAAIRGDGLEMFVTSNRPGGSGRIDLWVATRETTRDVWSIPVNLGVHHQYAVQRWRPRAVVRWHDALFLFRSPRGFWGTRSLRDDAPQDPLLTGSHPLEIGALSDTGNLCRCETAHMDDGSIMVTS